MHAAVIRKKQQAHPFVPFDILLPGEQRVHVPHPDYLFISPSGRYVEVWDMDDDETTLTTTLILGLKDSRKAGRRGQK